ncbi:hypothetical protein D030_3234B, partial [Vibrio parahaemolyticus AQ3810]
QAITVSPSYFLS